MARPLIVIIAVVAAAVIVGGVIWLWPGEEAAHRNGGAQPARESPTAAAPPIDKPGNPAVSTQANRTPAVATPADATDDTPAPEAPLSKALESMSQSLSAGDPRTPELAPAYTREQPAPEVLADPQRYAEYEEAQSRTIAAAYLSVLGQIPTLRARIEAARASGSQSPEDIAEAKEALAKLEELKREIESTHPEMLPPASPPDESLDNSAPPE